MRACKLESNGHQIQVCLATGKQSLEIHGSRQIYPSLLLTLLAAVDSHHFLSQREL